MKKKSNWVMALVITAIVLTIGAIAYSFLDNKPRPGRLEQRLSIITIGVDNFEVEKAFYKTKLGWKCVAENKDIVFFKLNGLLFSLFDRKQLANGAGVPAEGSGFRASTLGYVVNTRAEVDDLYQKFKGRGIHILKAPQSVPFGAYFFSFCDPEQNVFEVTFNPYIPLDEQGNVVTHKNIDNL